MPLPHLLDRICGLRDAVDEHEGQRRERTLHELRTHLALALVSADRRVRDLDGSAAVNVDVIEERNEARCSFTVDLADGEFPVPN